MMNAPSVPFDHQRTRRQQIVGFSLIALLLIGAGAYAWWRWQANRAPDEQLVEVPMAGSMDSAHMMRMRQAERGGPPPDVIRKSNRGFTARAGNAVMWVSQAKPGEWNLNFGYQPNIVTAEESAIILARWNSQTLGLTPDQVSKLEALGNFRGGMVVADPERQKMQSLWQAYVNATDATRPAAEKAVIGFLAELGQRCQDPTKAAIAVRIEKTRTILTPDQLAKLKTR